jgi:hypothetical protein
MVLVLCMLWLSGSGSYKEIGTASYPIYDPFFAVIKEKIVYPEYVHAQIVVILIITLILEQKLTKSRR